MTAAQSNAASSTASPPHPPEPVRRWLALAAICASAVLFGAGTVLSKAALDASVPPLQLLVVQLAASVTFLAVAVGVSRQRLPHGRADVRYGLTGLLEPGLSYLAAIAGLALTTAGNATTVGSVEPVVTAILAWLVLRQPMERRTVGLMVLALVGVLLVSGATFEARGNLSLLGDGLVLLGVVLAALYALTAARAVQAVPPLPLTLLQHSWGLGFILLGWVAAGLTHLVPGPTALAPGVWALAAASGIVNYALPYWLYLVAVRALPVTVAAQYLALVPVTGLIGGTAFLGEPAHAAQLAGVVLVVTSLAFLARPATSQSAAVGRILD